jgi:hypothetical protein
MVMTAQDTDFLARHFLSRNLVRTFTNLEMKRVEQGFNQSVAVLAVKVISTSFPTPIFTYVLTTLWVVVKRIRWPSEVLLSMSVIAFRPLMMLLIHQRAERSFITVEHKLFICQIVLQFI